MLQSSRLHQEIFRMVNGHPYVQVQVPPRLLEGSLDLRKPNLYIPNAVRDSKVAGAAVIFEVQRSSRSEARKEEVRRQEIQAIKTRNEELAREIELLQHKLEELEQLSRGRGLFGTLNYRPTHVSKNRKSN
ncbi:hypothetical protein ACSQ67_025453 [Phaseolus vulgaris]